MTVISDRPARDPALHLMHMIARARARRAAVIMAWSYLDETVNEPTSTMVVGGCTASQPAWNKFIAEWERALADEGVTEFHAKDFYAFQREFAWYDASGARDQARHDAFRDRLGMIIASHVGEIVGYSVEIERKKRGTKAAYKIVAEDSLIDAIRSCWKRDDPPYLVLARRPDIGMWALLEKFSNADWEGRLAGCAVFAPREVLPLQAADYVLHAINRRFQDEKTEAFKLLVREFSKRGKPFTTQLASSRHVRSTTEKPIS